MAAASAAAAAETDAEAAATGDAAEGGVASAGRGGVAPLLNPKASSEPIGATPAPLEVGVPRPLLFPVLLLRVGVVCAAFVAACTASLLFFAGARGVCCCCSSFLRGSDAKGELIVKEER